MLHIKPIGAVAVLTFVGAGALLASVFRSPTSLDKATEIAGSEGQAAVHTESLPRPREDATRSRLLRSIDPAVLRPLNGRAFQIVRLEDARPEGDALDYIQALLSRSAAGEAVATYRIYLAVRDCQIYVTGAAERALDAQGGGPSGLLKIDRKLDECAALSGNTPLKEGDWLSKAAEQGSLEAQLMYAIDVDSVLGTPSQRLAQPERVVEWKANSMAYLESAASAGSVDAVLRLSSAYSNGILVRADPERAYAYALVLGRTNADSSSNALAREMERRLSTKQQESARHLSHQIYQSCCSP